MILVCTSTSGATRPRRANTASSLHCCKAVVSRDVDNPLIIPLMSNAPHAQGLRRRLLHAYYQPSA